MRITITGAFERCLKRLSHDDRDDTNAALELFLRDSKSKALNFERVRSRAGYYTIRSNYSVRVLLREVGRDSFEAVAVGNHDYIYERHFR